MNSGNSNESQLDGRGTEWLKVSSAGLPTSPKLAIASALPKDVKVSFEFFPPDSDKANEALWACIERLQPLKPSYVSVTYGAGGTTRERTHNTVARIRKETDLEPAAHLTCVGADKGEVLDVARQYWDAGVRHIVALRGDPQKGESTYVPHPNGFAYASDLVAGLKTVGDFQISVAVYPEVHPEAQNMQAELDNLKRKVDAGATEAITQFFCDVDSFLRFLDRVRAAGITIPVIPGILPVTQFDRFVTFSNRCGTNVPPWMYDLFDGLDEDPRSRELVAAGVAAEQCRVLHAHGVDQFHFYTMNRADLCFAICHILGVRAQQPSVQTA